MNERTIKREIRFNGIGLHTGTKSVVTLLPADIGTGIIFHKNNTAIYLCSYNIKNTMMCTTIGNNGTQILTVEHLLATLFGLGIDNLHIIVDGDEIPIMDGSAIQFVNAILDVGIQDQRVKKTYIKLKKELKLQYGDKYISVSPKDNLSISARISFDDGTIKNQIYNYTHNQENFITQIAPARTFGFLKEISYLQEKGLALGASLDNAVGIDINGVMNERGLRYDSEFVRHKILDIIGDFAFLGYPFLASIISHKTGHRQHCEMVSEILHTKDSWELQQF